LDLLRRRRPESAVKYPDLSVGEREVRLVE
jgi:hypothetical protein